MEEVPTHLLRRLNTSRHFCALELSGNRKKLHLEVVGQLHLPGYPFLGQALTDQAMVLQGGAHLGSDGREELLVAGGEPASASATDEVDDPYGPGLPRRGRVPNRHGENGVSPFLHGDTGLHG